MIDGYTEAQRSARTPCPKCGSYSLMECGTWPFKRIVCFWIECDHEMKSWPPISVPLKQQEMT